jgi:hypothetical protein
MILNKLSLKDKPLFDKYLRLKEHSLSNYSFANIYIWNKFFDIRWQIIEESLCVFFRDNIGAFLYLSPLAQKDNPAAVAGVFNILKRINKNPEFAHIENIEEENLDFFRSLGLECSLKSRDYVCSRADLIGLKGNRFKSKRASLNYFTKHFDFSFQKLTRGAFPGCLKLHGAWLKQREGVSHDAAYKAMLKDSGIALKEALGHYSALSLQGGVVIVDGGLKAFTLGFPLNKDTFCVLFEITDLSLKGLAQFIFSEFARSLKGYKYINVMDDSGLDNLRKVKLSYHPQKLIGSYIARQR